MAVNQHVISVPVTYEYDSNPSLAPNGYSESRITINPAYNFSTINETSQFYFNLSLHAETSRTSSSSEQNRADPSAKIDWINNYNWGKLLLSVNATQQALRSSDEFSLSSVFEPDNTRQNRGFIIESNYKASENVTLSYTGNNNKVTYITSGVSALVDYQNTSNTLKINYQQSETNSLYTSATLDSYSPEQNGTSSRLTSINIGSDWKLSDQFNAQVSIGGNELKPENEKKSNSWQGSLNLNFTGSRSNLGMVLSRSFTPGSQGTVNETTSYNLNYKYVIAQTDNIDVALSLTNTPALSNLHAQILRFGYESEFSANSSWQISLEHKVRKDNLRSGSSNIFLAGINYAFTGT